MLRANSGLLCKDIDGLLVHLFEPYKIAGLLFFILTANLSISCAKTKKMYLVFFFNQNSNAGHLTFKN